MNFVNNCLFVLIIDTLLSCSVSGEVTYSDTNKSCSNHICFDPNSYCSVKNNTAYCECYRYYEKDANDVCVYSGAVLTELLYSNKAKESERTRCDDLCGFNSKCYTSDGNFYCVLQTNHCLINEDCPYGMVCNLQLLRCQNICDGS
ncbi:uncharacterized protein LOC103574571 [Microplitis demolitor]|uniref:uncharacterized protein LOC103574571 n=1 Tax=Microplitis demolitor TaxID=69319 RepID=UPI0004CD3A6A|nr:uncharacterized protein LOC103574571 [Microplitis demolitor]